MDKYIIINRESNQIVCKAKNSGRHYRQSLNTISNGLVIVQTTKGRAEKERDYLNQEYNTGWEIEKVEPFVLKDNKEAVANRMEAYEKEIQEAKKQGAKEFYESFIDGLMRGCGDDKDFWVVKLINRKAKKFGVKVGYESSND